MLRPLSRQRERERPVHTVTAPNIDHVKFISPQQSRLSRRWPPGTGGFERCGLICWRGRCALTKKKKGSHEKSFGF